MIRFLGLQFGFDLDLVRKVIRILRLERNAANGERWAYAGCEMPYPVPPEFFSNVAGSRSNHIWSLAWIDLETQNARGSAMVRTLLCAGSSDCTKVSEGFSESGTWSA